MVSPQQFDTQQAYWGSYWPSAGQDSGGVPDVSRVRWTQYGDHGPGAEILGNPATALEIGAATCVAGVALSRQTGAHVTCVDFSPVQMERARRWWGDEPGVTLVEADVLAFLAGTEQRWDCIFSDWGAAFFVDPARLLPLVLPRLTPGGLFTAAAVEPLLPCFGPQIKYGNGYRGRRLAVVRWMLSTQDWTNVLLQNGFSETDVRVLPGPEPDWVGTQLVRAWAPR